MPLLDMLDPTSSMEMKKHYESIRYENESPYRRILLHNLEVLRAQNTFQETLLEAGPIDEVLFEYIMITVAQKTGCEYSAGSHRLKLQSMGGVSEELLEALAEYDYSDLDDRIRPVVELADQMTTDPHHVTEDHIEALRSIEFDDSDIVQLLSLIGFCNFATQIANALQITPADRSDDLPTY